MPLDLDELERKATSSADLALVAIAKAARAFVLAQDEMAWLDNFAGEEFLQLAYALGVALR